MTFHALISQPFPSHSPSNGNLFRNRSQTTYPKWQASNNDSSKESFEDILQSLLDEDV